VKGAYLLNFRVLYLSDLHWMYRDPTTVRHYMYTNELVYNDIIRCIKDQKITHIIQGGDWCDTGYKSIGYNNRHSSMVEELRDLVNGNLFMVIGNHINLKKDDNPEVYWIQPTDRIQCSITTVRKQPLIKTPDYILLNTTQISLFHFNKDNKEYHRNLEPYMKHHIGCFHDDYAIPNSITSNMYMNATQIERIYANIDVAIHGHIHIPQDPMTIRVGNREVAVFIPGSHHIQTVDSRDLHMSIKAPIIEVSDKGYKMHLYEFKTYAEELNFRRDNKESHIEIARTLKSIKENKSNDVKVKTLGEYLKLNGIRPCYIETLRKVSLNKISLQEYIEEVCLNELTR